MAPRVLVSDELSETAVQIFRDRGVEVDFQPKLGKDKEKLAEIIGNYDGLAIRSATKATEKLIAAATNLKVIGRAGIGVDNVDIPAASKRGIIVMNTPFGNSITTAEHAIALMFAVARQLPQADASTQAGKWEKSKFMGVEITGKTLGVIGAGNIGGIVCKKAIGFAMLGVGVFSLWCRWKGTLHSNHWLHRVALVMGPSGFVAVLAGWITTEVGRQPYTVYGHLLTADSISPIAAPAVAASLIAFIVVYFIVFGAGTFYILRLMGRLPRDPMPDLDDGPIRTSGTTPASQTGHHGGKHAH